MNYLKQSTASQAQLIGPYIDDTDGKTAETGLTIANTDLRLSKNGGNMAAKNSGGGTHDEAGMYTVTFDATDTDTVGRLQVTSDVSGALPVYHEFQVLEEAVFDALFASGATGLLPANLTQIDGDAQSSADFKDFVDDGYDPTTNKVQGVVLVDTATDVTNDVGITQAGADKAWSTTARILTAATNITSDGSAINVTSGVVDSVTLVATTTANSDMRGTNLALLDVSAPTNFSDLAITSGTGQVTVGTNNDKTGYSISGTITTLDGLNNFNPATDAVADVTLVATTTTNTDMITAAEILAQQLTENYAANGAAPTLEQVLMIMNQFLQEFSIVGTLLTVKKLDQLTTAATYTLDDSNSPTAITRAS